jgi:hypothetical protein
LPTWWKALVVFGERIAAMHGERILNRGHRDTCILYIGSIRSRMVWGLLGSLSNCKQINVIMIKYSIPRQRPLSLILYMWAAVDLDSSWPRRLNGNATLARPTSSSSETAQRVLTTIKIVIVGLKVWLKKASNGCTI